MRKIPSIYLLMFWAVTGTIGVAHSLLLTQDTAWYPVAIFYILTWASSAIILLYCRVVYKEVHQFDYDEGLSSNKLLYVLGGLVAVIFVSSIFVSGFTQSSIWIPQPQMSLAVAGLGLSSVVNDIFFQISLVANSEETMCLSISQVIRRAVPSSYRLRRFSKFINVSYASVAMFLAITIPRAGWAVLHAYFSYTGALMPVLVFSAFVSGCIISYAAYNKDVESLLVAILIHALFNISVILGSSMGLI
jgi:hypothetical protein